MKKLLAIVVLSLLVSNITFAKKNKNKDCSSRDPQNYHKTVIHQDYLRGQWHDMVFNGKWSVKQDGYFKQWINGKLVYHYQGSN